MADSSLKQSYMGLYESKSDAELQDIIMRNANIVNGLSAYSTPEQLADAKVKVAQTEACVEIINNREEWNKWLKDAKKEFADKEGERKLAALRNLRYAASANGQLIAAILQEEHRMTQEEIFNWCDELRSIEAAEQAELLEGLAREGIIRKNESGQYELITLCTDSLMPYPYIVWAIERVKERKESKGLLPLSPETEEQMRLILSVISMEGTALTAKDVLALIQDDQYRKLFINPIFSDDVCNRLIYSEAVEITDYNINRLMTSLRMDGVLQVVHLPVFNGTAHYFTYLGSKEAKA